MHWPGRSRLTRLTLLALAGSGCADQVLESVDPGLFIPDRLVVLPPVPLGMTSSASFRVVSHSGRTRRISLKATNRFEVPSSVDVPSQATELITVRFTPEVAGRQTGVATLRIEGRTEEVNLVATGEALTCAPARVCMRLDTSDGRCLLSPVADGQGCREGCITDGRCRAGTCVGAGAMCDDGDACTVDACGASEGRQQCTHARRECPAATSPCQRASCDPKAGCQLEAVEDGAQCGPSDCSTQHVCLQGQCVRRAPPDGAECGQASPCQAKGRCQQGRCQPGAVSPLAPVWTRSVEADVDWLGLWDVRENVYWLERDVFGLWAVSVDRNGVPRFRVMLPSPEGFDPVGAVSASSSALLEAGLLVLASPASDRLLALDLAAGTSMWSARLAPELHRRGYGAEGRCRALAPGDVALRPLAGDGAGLVALVAHVAAGTACLPPGAADAWLVTLEARTGAVRWAERIRTALEPNRERLEATLLFDGAGALMAGVEHPKAGDTTVRAFDVNGLRLWESVFTGRHVWPRAAGAGLLITTGPSALTPILDAFTGRSVAALGVADHLPTPLLTPQQALVFSTDGRRSQLKVTGVSLLGGPTTATSTLVRSAGPDVPVQATLPVITSRREVLLGWGPAPGGAVMVGTYALNGAPSLECPLQGAGAAGGQPVLLSGRLVLARPADAPTSVEAYELSGVELAAEAWPTSRGGPSQAGRPHP